MMPTGSWPMVRPAATGYSPLRMCTSVPQMVVVVIRSKASFGPISGMGLSCSSMRPGSINTAAFIMAMGLSWATKALKHSSSWAGREGDLGQMGVLLRGRGADSQLPGGLDYSSPAEKS
ncbi:hypothetical protein FQZ97_1165970 [compost metagenome]